MKATWFCGLLAGSVLVAGCAPSVVTGVKTQPEARIWVVGDNNRLFRCADTVTEGDPKPVCKEVPLR